MSGFASIMGPPSTPSTGSSTGRFLRNMGSPAVNTPSTGGYQSRPMTSNSLVSGMRLAALREPYSESNDMPISPEAKRRRSTNATHGPVRAENGQLTPLPLNRRRESLPRPDFMQKSNFSIAAAPKPNNPSSSQEGPFTLPPIKTAHVSEASTQAKSVEAMVMSISAINKIKVLAKICPPLAPPGPTSPPQAIRGAIIAIDGTDTESIKATIEHLSEIFAKDPKHTLRIFESPPLKSSTGGEASFADYLQLINRWHSLSQEIIKFITSAPPVSPPTLISPKTIPPPNIAPPTESAADPSNLNPSSTTGPAPSSFPQHHPAPFPIALIPCYQLTRTDAAASTIPIADAYAPIDHWQWMATLWRGIVGPDITIVVRAASHETTSVGSNGVMSPGADVGRHGSVEVRLNDARAIVLRGNGKGKGVSESGLRRVGFEVGEWVRMLASAKEGRGLG
ncbi:hypothetical protein MMC30_001230 [Trapelia coarctata]|nr:hypothetical protein [Trapelia coarctata]